MKEEEEKVIVEIGSSKGEELLLSDTVTVIGQVAALEDCVWCEDISEHRLLDDAQHVWNGSSWVYVSSSCNDVHHGYINRGERGLFWNSDYEYSDRDDEYFFNGTTAERCGYYYYDSVADWRDEQPEEERERENMYRFDYHSGNRHSYLSDQAFGIGFEVEKEDFSAMSKESASDVWRKSKWAKERDGSLDCDSGYELVSPVFPLFEHDFAKEFKKVDYLINANYTTACGGHINLSMKGKDNKEFLNMLSGWLPLFYAMYHGRIGATYCRAKKKENYGDGEKYSAIYLKSRNIVEFRIVSAVRDTDNLLWRTELFKIICTNLNLTELQVLRMLIDPKSKLYNHMRFVYGGDKIMKLIRNFVTFSAEWNDAKMPSLTAERIKQFEERIIKKKGDKK